MSVPNAQHDSASGKPETQIHWVLLGLSLAVLAAALVLDTRGSRQVILPPAGVSLPESCMFHRTTGFDCPGCGLTRCFIAIVHGRWEQAWHFNPAGYAIFALVAFQVPYQLFQLRRIGRGLEPARLLRAEWFLVAMIPLLIVQWILRLIGIL